MDAFENLPQEKRGRIINAAMGVFATHGYRKASAADIAKAAEISKAMVFTYFGSKRGCYEFMCNEMLRVSLEEFEKVKQQILSVTDYFERMTQYLEIKVELLNRYSSLLSFAKSVYTEGDEEVRPIINEMLSEVHRLREMLASADIDPARFKNPADAVSVGKITRWLSQGCTDDWAMSKHDSIGDLIEVFREGMEALKKHFYKEEYL